MRVVLCLCSGKSNEALVGRGMDVLCYAGPANVIARGGEWQVALVSSLTFLNTIASPASTSGCTVLTDKHSTNGIIRQVGNTVYIPPADLSAWYHLISSQLLPSPCPYVVLIPPHSAKKAKGLSREGTSFQKLSEAPEVFTTSGCFLQLAVDYSRMSPH